MVLEGKKDPITYPKWLPDEYRQLWKDDKDEAFETDLENLWDEYDDEYDIKFWSISAVVDIKSGAIAVYIASYFYFDQKLYLSIFKSLNSSNFQTLFKVKFLAQVFIN